MAFLWTDNKVAVEVEELVPRFWNSAHSLQVEIQRYKAKPYGLKRLQIGGNGRRLLLDYDSLRDEIKLGIYDPRKVEHPLEMFFEIDADAVRYYSKYKRGGKNYLHPDEQEKYIVNASVMKAAIRLKEARTNQRIQLKGSTRGISDTVVYDVENYQDVLYAKHGKQHSLPSGRRLKDLLRQCSNDLYYPIIKDPEGKSSQNARKVDDRVAMILNALFKNQTHKPTPTEIARQYDAFLNGYAELYNEDSGEIYDPKEFKPLSQQTITSYINRWENKIATHLARSGDRQVYMNQYKVAHEMELPKFSSSLISVDDRQPPFLYDKGKRAWFYLGLDVASQCFTTVVWGKTKEGLIVDFYRQMARTYHEWGLPIPYELECESSLNSSFRDTLLRNGNMFQNVRIEANNARGKYIERVFGMVRYGEEKKALGWVARPFAKTEANQKRAGQDVIQPYDQIIEDRLQEIENWNNSPHPTQKDMTRFDYFIAHQNPNLPPTKWIGILPYIGFKTETSCNVGKVKLQRSKFSIAENGEILTGEALIEKMRLIEGKEVDVYWLDGTDGQVIKAMAFIGDRYVCELQEMPKYNRAVAEQTEADKKAYQLQSAYTATIDAYARTKRNSIESIGIMETAPKTINNNFKFSFSRKTTIVEEIDEEDLVIGNEIEDLEELVIDNLPTANDVDAWRKQWEL